MNASTPLRSPVTESGTTSSGGPHHTLANQLHVSSSTRCVAIVAVQYGPRVSPDRVVTISATSIAHPVLLHLLHHVLQQRAQPERAHRACATSPPAGRAPRVSTSGTPERQWETEQKGGWTALRSTELLGCTGSPGWWHHRGSSSAGRPPAHTSVCHVTICRPRRWPWQPLLAPPTRRWSALRLAGQWEVVCVNRGAQPSSSAPPSRAAAAPAGHMPTHERVPRHHLLVGF